MDVLYGTVRYRIKKKIEYQSTVPQSITIDHGTVRYITLQYDIKVCVLLLRVGIFLDRIFSSFHVTAAQHFNSIFFSTQNSFSCFALMLSGNFLQSTSTGTGNIWCCIISFVLYQQYRAST